MFDSRSVLYSALGFNVQPEGENEFEAHRYLCNGCDENIYDEEPRYTRLACAPEKMMSFCSLCVQKICGSIDEERKR